MDLSKDRVLKDNETFVVADEGGQITGGEHGLYCRDTRFLNRYVWRFGEEAQTLLAFTPRPDRFRAHYAVIDGPSQRLGFSRELALGPRLMTDTLRVENTSLESRRVELTLGFAGDFVDMFEARGWMRLERVPAHAERTEAGARFAYQAQDGLELAVALEFSLPPTSATDEEARFALELAPGQSQELTVRVRIHADAEPPAFAPISYGEWRESFNLTLKRQDFQAVVNQAIDDLRALLIFTEHGPYPAAGIPWYVAAFGRDALLTAMMMLPWRPDVAEATLRFLAAHQGRGYDPKRAEAPGKIMHELRHGELTRLGKMPHGPYYGTIDATPLFVMLLHDLFKQSGKLVLVEELRPHWEAALQWMLKDGDQDGDGFLEFMPAAEREGLAVQSWKDSHDSMSHEDGSLATGALAVSEVQGYAFAAFMAASEFYQASAPSSPSAW